jgi:SNF2 family DNA or RNA helicase
MVAMQDGREMTTQIVMTQLLRLHQIACGHVKWDSGEVQRIPNNRLSELLALLEDASGEKAIVWCSYRSDADAVAGALRDRFGRDAVSEWHGGIGTPAREAGEAAFQNGAARYMVASQQAAGRGRTWTAATLVVYYSNSHSLEDRQQSEDRAHRIGQTGTVTIVDLVARGTVDERIIKSLRANLDVVRAALQDGPSTWV